MNWARGRGGWGLGGGRQIGRKLGISVLLLTIKINIKIKSLQQKKVNESLLYLVLI